MTLQSGTAGTSVVGSDHVAWKCRYFLTNANIVNATLLSALASKSILDPICRVYVKNVSTGTVTEIPGVVTYASIRNDRTADRGTFSLTVTPELKASTFSDLFSTYLDTTFDYYIIIKAGYKVAGEEILVSIMKGFAYDRLPSFGGGSSSIVINGADLGEKISRTTGIWSGYTSAKTLIRAILKAAGFNTINDSGFTDFSISSSFSFSNNNGAEVISRLSDYAGTFSHYFDGAGIYTVKDQDNSTDPTADYTFANAVLGTFNPSRSLREYWTKVNVVGDGVALTRQTDSTDRSRYGDNKFTTIQNSLITTLAECRTAADLVINTSRKDQGHISNVAFNPYFKIGTVLAVNHQEIGGTKKYRVNGFTHTFMGGRFTSTLQCERTDYTAPTIEDAP